MSDGHSPTVFIADGWAYPTSILPRTWGYRAGKLTANQLPFMVLLAMKNSPISCESSFTAFGRSSKLLRRVDRHRSRKGDLHSHRLLQTSANP